MPRTVDPEKREAAMSLLREGASVTTVHRQTKINRDTLYRWARQEDVSPVSHGRAHKNPSSGGKYDIEQIALAFVGGAATGAIMETFGASRTHVCAVIRGERPGVSEATAVLVLVRKAYNAQGHEGMSLLAEAFGLVDVEGVRPWEPPALLKHAKESEAAKHVVTFLLTLWDEVAEVKPSKRRDALGRFDALAAAPILTPVQRTAFRGWFDNPWFPS